ncbi:hypothetical protein [Priestia megaterium]|uniref:hypothetical protein n=1 Tax=Priestia megaterium TaxID=1404 RepID=UPI000BEC727E|nr:hypothetical protein [Priestia megaterium]PED64013.1 hypothetical protein CON20_23915 [Priestia megaterium]
MDILKSVVEEKVVMKEVTELKKVVVKESVIKPNKEAVEKIAASLIKGQYRPLNFMITHEPPRFDYPIYRERSMEMELDMELDGKPVLVTIKQTY